MESNFRYKMELAIDDKTIDGISTHCSYFRKKDEVSLGAFNRDVTKFEAIMDELFMEFR